ncbi:ABC transporter ATP-binding protein [Herbaspirillum sp. BH-1]|uniref:Spermidine/putrescine transport system ATP-binding protein n=1 Tax=Herbaspirillum frisingense TaxID=92645 RepID=A0ABU1PG90_9BURK|nr:MULTISPECIES: ABC transporter ATP-binding protein [Herbaspirillum]MDR6584961.1 putative spermidine/putrescine transport system ATP-binding protein [Herbaspirillum frisingense]PLY60816.1 ABC transporter ATP-binding protein [Herbaspirillum sp. BH-1]
MKSKKEAVSIRLHQCAKSFANGTRALQPLDLEIHPGETLVLLGPSGCGKTTTLRMIAGLEFPDEGGRVLFGEDDVTALPIEKRGVGMVFQNYALFPNMSVGENIAYGMKIRKIPAGERAERVEKLLEMVHLQGLSHRRVDQLSGGQKQRVALARALAMEPRVLLLDEPLTALDAKLREAVRSDLNKLLRSLGITAIYVTHDQGEAMALGDRIVVMERGKISQIGTPREIYYHPANDFVADFIGAMNRVQGIVSGDRLLLPNGSLPLPDAGNPMNATQQGQPVWAMFRPEDVQVVDITEADAQCLRGKLINTFFLGDRTRFEIEIGAERPVIAETSRRGWWEAGQQIALRVPAEALVKMVPAAEKENA